MGFETIMEENGFITSTLHSDRRLGTQYGAIHQPLHPSTEFGFQDARELAAVFQGKAGFTYSRQGTPTTAALEAKITRMEKGGGQRQLCNRYGRIDRHPVHFAAPG
jgi:O-acetylhomoserine (thiol)-lyase